MLNTTKRNRRYVHKTLETKRLADQLPTAFFHRVLQASLLWAWKKCPLPDKELTQKQWRILETNEYRPEIWNHLNHGRNHKDRALRELIPKHVKTRTDKAKAFCPMEHKTGQTPVKKIIQPSQKAKRLNCQSDWIVNQTIFTIHSREIICWEYPLIFSRTERPPIILAYS